MFVILDEDGFVFGMGATAGDAAIECAQHSDHGLAYWTGRAVPAAVELVARVRQDGPIAARMGAGTAWPYGVDVTAPGAMALCDCCGGCGLVLDVDGFRPVAVPCVPCAGRGVVL